MIADGYDSPEAAVVAEWDGYATARVRIVEVRYTGEHEAVVITDTEPSHPMFNRTRLTKSGWVFLGDSN